MMNRKRSVLAGALAVVVLAAFSWAAPDEPNEPLEIGSKAPLTDVAMEGVSGETYTLDEVAGENGLLVVFSCNTCPWVEAWEDRYPKLADQARELGIGMIAPNPNTAIRDDGESMADMKARADEQGYNFPYVLDKDAQLAAAFGATRTPDVFLFNGDMELVYRGAIDDNARDASAVENHYLMDAMTAMVNGQDIENQVTKSIGCTIKWAD